LKGYCEAIWNIVSRASDHQYTRFSSGFHRLSDAPLRLPTNNFQGTEAKVVLHESHWPQEVYPGSCSVMSSITPTRPTTLPSRSVKVPLVNKTSWRVPSAYCTIISHCCAPGSSKRARSARRYTSPKALGGRHQRQSKSAADYNHFDNSGISCKTGCKLGSLVSSAMAIFFFSSVKSMSFTT
jgi:hypothetical protein